MSEEINEALKGYVKYVQSIQTVISTWDENKVKTYLIPHLLKALHWDPTVYDPDYSVTLEHSFKLGASEVKADYVLKLKNSPLCVIEVKRVGKVDNEAAKQALSYAKVLNAPWGLVTDGVKLCLYGTKLGRYEDVKDALVEEIMFDSEDKVDEHQDFLECLARENLASDSTNNKFQKLNERNALCNFLGNKKEELVEVITKWTEEQWGRGAVDKTLLRSFLGDTFGKIKIVEVGKESGGRGHPPTSTGNTLRNELRRTVAGEWEYKPGLGTGIFQYRYDPSKQIDVSKSISDVADQLKEHGLYCICPNGFHYQLRVKAGLIGTRTR